MATVHIRNFTSGLPASLRDSIEGYVDAVAAALPEIERGARVRIPANGQDEFLLIVAIRRLWALVNHQFSIMSNCVAIVSQTSAAKSPGADELLAEPRLRGFRVGSEEVSYNSEPFRESATLQSDLAELIRQLEIDHLVRDSATLNEVASRMFGEHHGRR